jgi:hypothetical protein
VRRLGEIALAAAVTALAGPAMALGQSSQPTAPWDGENPFNCKLQYAGTQDVGPHPEVDPYCVEFDKTEQNITDSGLVDFLALEPRRVGAAGPKCFYFQADHWTGWVVQGEPPELWHWDGHYFFDKAQGIGGVFIENFRIGGKPANPAPYAPPQYRPYFSDGGGGLTFTKQSDVDPSCVKKVDTAAERRDVYRFRPRYPNCVPPGGEMRRRSVGQIDLGMRRNAVRRRLGKPRRQENGTDRWCLIGDAQLRVAYKGQTKRVAGIWTSSRGHRIRDVGAGTHRRRAVRRLDLEPRYRIRHTKVLSARAQRKAQLFAGIRHRRVRWLAITDARLVSSGRAAQRVLRRMN